MKKRIKEIIVMITTIFLCILFGWLIFTSVIITELFEKYLNKTMDWIEK